MKKFIAIILSICILIGVCGCAGNKPANPSKDKDKTPSSSVVTDTNDDNNSSDESDNSSDTSSKDETDKQQSDNETDDNDSIDFDEDETTSNITIKVPGTENWSDAADALTLTVSNETIGKFNHFGWFITELVSEFYMSLSKQGNRN